MLAKRRTAIRNFRIVQREGRRVTLSRKTAKNETLPKGWRWVKIIDFSPLQRGFDLPTGQIEEGAYPVVYSNGINNYHSEYKSKAPGVVTGRSGTIGEVTYVTQDYWPHNTSLWVTDFKDNHPKFVFYALQNLRLDRFHAGSGVPTLNRNDVHKQSILVPPLSEQKAIASLLETWETAIEKTEALIAAKEKQFKWLLRTFISDEQDNPRWREVRLGDVCEKIVGGGTPSTENPDYWQGHIPWITSADIVSYKTIKYRKYITDQALDNSATNLIPKNNIIVVTRVGLGKAVRNDVDVCISQDSQGLILKKSIYPDFLINFLIEKIKIFKSASQGSTIKGITKRQLADIKIPLPSLPEQKVIASLLEKAQEEIDILKQLAEQYRTQKHGLMQKLLTGKWQIRDQSAG